ncbi:MAG: DUF4340 domain-containing protein, partial [Spirochaetaceae bacterium]|nr:DUF4340 domain-containing protein [Spirochaetaceae bacterium]
MAFRNKLAALSALAGVLLASYVLTFALSPETRASRASRWSALGAKAALEADAVALSGAEDLSLVKTNGVWFVDAAGNQFPARASRVEDLFSALTREGFYPVRSRSAASYEKFGVGDNRRGAIVVKSGGVILLELYLGNEGVSGNEAYLRSGAEEAVRSGADVFSSFTG